MVGATTVLGERFELDRLVGAGGMGRVYRARDRTTQQPVAVKMLSLHRPQDAARFAREAGMLAAIHDPAIVGYIGHGLSATGEPYLIMEWLEGEDLGAVLQRRRLTLLETLTLGERVAGALATLHAQGVIHRDIKPSNIFLVGGDVAAAKLVDLGLARVTDASTITKSGAVVGTLGYMAPEQARGDESALPQTDLFALGSVLFACLTGAPPFTAHHVLALLTKILFADVPSLCARYPEAPPELDALLARMLCREPEQRARDARAVRETLRRIATTSWSAQPVAGTLTPAERHLVSMLLVDAPAPGVSDDARFAAEQQALLGIATEWGGRAEALGNGAVAVLMGSGSLATDKAAMTARCALALRDQVRDRRVALTTSWSDLSDRSFIGAAIDRTVAMLTSRGPSSDEHEPLIPILLDDATAELLDTSFDVRGEPGAFTLHAERPRGTRLLVGRQTPCVGRDREMALVLDLVDECIQESAPRAVVVTARAGIGKTRLAHELVERIRERHPNIAVWEGQGAARGAGSAFLVVRTVLQRIFDVHGAAPLDARRQKVLARTSRHIPELRRRRVAEFLGEMMGVPFADDTSPQLWAARCDPQVMGEQMATAWEEFVRAESGPQPLLLVLDDLHWGDLPSVKLVERAMRRIGSRPFMVLAFARPELDELFPKLWAGRPVQRIELRELTRKASEELVRSALGDDVGDDTVERVVVQAEGHAFFLEELVRMVAAGKGASLPPTILAMLEARLAALTPELRRILRAASVLGDIFWSGAVAELLTSRPDRTDLRDRLDELVDSELLEPRHHSRFPGHAELAFRHALLRETAYAMLTDEDRQLGHRRAAEWLEREGETDPMVLADHFFRGGEPARAGGYYYAACEQAFRGLDMLATITSARQGLACNPAAPARAELLGWACTAHGARREWAEAAACGVELAEVATPGTYAWMIGASARFIVSEDPQRAEEYAFAMLAGEDSPTPVEARARVAFGYLNAYVLLICGGRADLAEHLLTRLRQRMPLEEAADATLQGLVFGAEVIRSLGGRASLWHCALAGRRALETLIDAPTIYRELFARFMLGYSYWGLGAYEEALPVFDAIRSAPVGMGAGLAAASFVYALADIGELDRAEREAAATIARSREQGMALEEAQARAALADVLLRRGHLDDAEREINLALAPLTMIPFDHMAAQAVLAAILLARGRTREALAAAEASMAQYTRFRGHGFRGTFARLVHTEVLRAGGEPERARVVLRAARDYVVEQAAAVPEPDARRAFFERVPENVRVLRLAEEILGDR